MCKCEGWIDLKLPSLIVGFCSLTVLIFFTRRWKLKSSNHYFGVFASLLFVSLGAFLGNHSISRQKIDFESLNYVAIVESVPVEKENSYSAELKIFASQVDSHNLIDFDARIIAYFEKSSLSKSITPGDVISFHGYFSNEAKKLYPLQFDYHNYLRNCGISGTVFIPKPGLKLVDLRRFSLRAQLNNLRSFLLDCLNQARPPSKEFGVISALVLGDKRRLDADLQRQFSNAGVVHVLAVSGLHVGIIYLFLGKLIAFLLKKRGRIVKFIFVLLILWGYAALTGFSPSVLRAVTMFSFIAMGKHHGKYGNVYNLIAGSALLLLAINPLLITQVGFQLSYFAVIGIVYFHPKFYSLITFQKWLPDKIWSLTCVSLAAQLATFPLSIFYFHQFPILFPLTNILVIPLATAILYLGIFWLCLSWVPYLSYSIAFLTIKITSILNAIIDWFNDIPFVNASGLYVSELETISLYLLILGIAGFISKPVFRRLRYSIVIAVLLVISFISRSLRNTLQDDIYVALWKKEPTFIRLIKDRAYVYSNDTLASQELLSRDLMPFLLSKGINADQSSDFIHFKNFKATFPSRMDSLNLLYDHKSSKVFISSKSGRISSIELCEPFTHINSDGLIRFSTDQLPPRK